MKATGIVRRIDDLGRVVIPKEIRRTMRIREGDPLEIYTSRDGEVIFKKYSMLGGLEDFAVQLCETMSRSTGRICAIADRDAILSVSGGRKDLYARHISRELEQIMEDRRIYRRDGNGNPVPVCEEPDPGVADIIAPILSEGDVLGAVLFIAAFDSNNINNGELSSAPTPGDTEYKLAQTIAGFLGRHMET